MFQYPYTTTTIAKNSDFFLRDKQRLVKGAIICLLTALAYNTANAVEFSGKTELEITAYEGDGQFSEQDYRYNTSLAAEPELYWEWDKGNNSLTFKPFIRADQRDDERSHADIRELDWTYVKGHWELHAGIRKVFWGVTEFNHLVDIINQTDGVESFDGEEKLGQPMINLSRVTDWGIIDAFILTGFRERTFAGEEGRLRSSLVVDTDSATYESDDEEKHIDYALRWSHSFNVFDLGIYWFDGTDRDPLLTPTIIDNKLVLTPFYQQISQVGVDLQATVGNWLWKFEGLHRDGRTEDYLATQAGFEYTFYGISQSASDLGVLLEYGWDERDQDATSIAQNDIYIGTRLTLNDANDSSLLMGASYDIDYHTRSLLIEASRRLTDRWTIAIEGLILESSDRNDPTAALDKDDRLQLKLERYF